MSHSEKLQRNIAPLNERLLSHPIYTEMRSIEDVQTFMENHVFAVWDFMTVLKTLQRHLTCVEPIWIPTNDPHARRLINEIVLCEESDEDGDGGYASHFEMYLTAMQQCHANTKEIGDFISALQNEDSPKTALEKIGIADCTKQFVQRTLTSVAQLQTCELAASFAYGREHLLPEVFERVIDEVGELGGERLGYFVHYLRRHIEVDGDSHGPMADAMICQLCGESEMRWHLAEQAAISAWESRIRLWDGVLSQIKSNRSKGQPGQVTTTSKDHFLEPVLRDSWNEGIGADERRD